jgi:hypothetical protein
MEKGDREQSSYVCEAGDLFFKATQTRWDSWATVQQYQVYLYSDKDTVLATVTNRSRKRSEPDYAVEFPDQKNTNHVFQDLNKVSEFIVGHYYQETL